MYYMSRRTALRGVGLPTLMLAALLSGACESTTQASGTRTEFRAALNGGNESPPNMDLASGEFRGSYDSGSQILDWQLKHTRLSGRSTAMEIVMPVASTTAAHVEQSTTTLSRFQARELIAGRIYVNISTAQYPNGEVRGRVEIEGNQPAGQSVLRAHLTGGGEVVANSGVGQGEFVGNYEPTSRQISWQLVDARLTGPPTGIAFTVPMSGTALGSSGYRGTMVLTDVQEADLRDGRWYVNILTAKYPKGEIRGQIVPR